MRLLLLTLTLTSLNITAQVTLKQSNKDLSLYILDCEPVEEFGAEDSIVIKRTPGDEVKIQFPHLGTETNVALTDFIDSENPTPYDDSDVNVYFEKSYGMMDNSTFDLSTLVQGTYSLDIIGCHVGCPLISLILKEK
jgi:hypothetical protein